MGFRASGFLRFKTLLAGHLPDFSAVERDWVSWGARLRVMTVSWKIPTTMWLQVSKIGRGQGPVAETLPVTL